MNNDNRIKPIIILAPDSMSEEDIKVLRENQLCVVVSTNPEAVKFVDSITAISNRTEVENAAIQLSPKVLKGVHPEVGRPWTPTTVSEFAKLFVDILIEGTALDPGPTRSEKEQEYFSAAKMDEIRRLAIQEAREERAAAKAAKAKAKKAHGVGIQIAVVLRNRVAAGAILSAGQRRQA